MTTRPLPVSSAWSAPFWEAASQHKLVYQFCTAAQKPVMYPKRLSPHSLAETLEWRESAGKGEVYTYTIQRLGAPSGFAEELPYVIAVVRLDEGFQMLTNIVGERAEKVACGSRVRVVFSEAMDGTVLPLFELDEAA